MASLFSRTIFRGNFRLKIKLLLYAARPGPAGKGPRSLRVLRKGLQRPLQGLLHVRLPIRFPNDVDTI